jgi:hypothetical protein
MLAGDWYVSRRPTSIHGVDNDEPNRTLTGRKCSTESCCVPWHGRNGSNRFGPSRSATRARVVETLGSRLSPGQLNCAGTDLSSLNVRPFGGTDRVGTVPMSASSGRPNDGHFGAEMLSIPVLNCPASQVDVGQGRPKCPSSELLKETTPRATHVQPGGAGRWVENRRNLVVNEEQMPSQTGTIEEIPRHAGNLGSWIAPRRSAVRARLAP